MFCSKDIFPICTTVIKLWTFSIFSIKSWVKPWNLTTLFIPMQFLTWLGIGFTWTLFLTLTIICNQYVNTIPNLDSTTGINNVVRFCGFTSFMYCLENIDLFFFLSLSSNLNYNGNVFAYIWLSKTGNGGPKFHNAFFHYLIGK